MNQTLYLVDASIYVFRSYYAVEPAFFDRAGAPVQAVHGFLNFLLSCYEQAQFTHALVAFDASLTQSFRNTIYPAYKANRERPPEDLLKQFSYCQALTRALGIPTLSNATYEADDLIGSAVHHMRQLGYRSVIVTGDKDLSQLLADQDLIWDFARQERYGATGVYERLGVRADQVADFLALRGDGVDNIPGVPGIGAKSAASLLAHFGSLDALLNRVDEIPYLRSVRGAAAIADKLRQHRDQALLCQQLTRIALNAPVPMQAEGYLKGEADTETLNALIWQLRIGPLTRRRVERCIQTSLSECAGLVTETTH